MNVGGYGGLKRLLALHELMEGREARRWWEGNSWSIKPPNCHGHGNSTTQDTVQYYIITIVLISLNFSIFHSICKLHK